MAKAHKAMWSGTIGFGMLSIPVQSFKAADSEDLSFKQLHGACGTPIKQQKVCPTHGNLALTGEDIVKGFEVAKNSFIHLTDDDLKQVPLPAKDTIAIQEFVPVEAIDPVRVVGSYYLQSGKGGAKALALLMRGLQDRALAAIGTVAFRQRESLVALRVDAEGRLVLHTLYTDDEVRDVGERLTQLPAVTEKELGMINMLIDMHLKPTFTTAAYVDHYEEALRQLIARKEAGQPLAVTTTPAAPQAMDLEALLKASLDQAQAA
jgi:DNA end-binding protein Ku